MLDPDLGCDFVGDLGVDLGGGGGGDLGVIWGVIWVAFGDLGVIWVPDLEGGGVIFANGHLPPARCR
jgi:hypothetical protein